MEDNVKRVVSAACKACHESGVTQVISSQAGTAGALALSKPALALLRVFCALQ